MSAKRDTHHEIGEQTPALKNSGAQKMKSEDSAQSEIIALCRQAESLVALMEAGAGSNDPENANIRDTAFERVCAIGNELIHYVAAGPADILAKIRLWRLLALEDALDPERSSPDEQLLASIIDDIEDHLAPA